MKRSLMMLTAAVALVACGCAKKNQQTRMTGEEPYTPPQHTTLDSMDAAPASPSYTYTTTADNNATPAYTTTYNTHTATPAPAPAPAPVYTATSSDEPLAPAGGKTYVVRKGDTLYGLARKFYNDQSRWRDIYNANRDRLSSPNQLRVGMRLVIP